MSDAFVHLLWSTSIFRAEVKDASFSDFLYSRSQIKVHLIICHRMLIEFALTTKTTSAPPSCPSEQLDGHFCQSDWVKKRFLFRLSHASRLHLSITLLAWLQYHLQNLTGELHERRYWRLLRMYLGFSVARKLDQYVGMMMRMLGQCISDRCLDNLNLRGYEDKKRLAVSMTESRRLNTFPGGGFFSSDTNM